jgi:hypothetical protein
MGTVLRLSLPQMKPVEEQALAVARPSSLLNVGTSAHSPLLGTPRGSQPDSSTGHGRMPQVLGTGRLDVIWEGSIAAARLAGMDAADTT